MPKLTILLPLKGRHLHTLRFLWHANRVRLPYRFLIADGEVHPQIAGLLENSADIFPNLDIDYVRYPDDDSYTQFYRKMADAAGKIKTPYVMQADNDDFLIASGIDHCIDQLEANSDFASYGGGVGGFTLRRNDNRALDTVMGAVDSFAFRFMGEYLPHDYLAPTAEARICDAFEKTHVFYYNVFRTENLATILREIMDLDFTDLQLHETYFGMRAKTFGKSRSDGAVMTYMRQGGTATQQSFRVDWIAHLLRSRFTSDFTNMLDRISAAVEYVDGRADPSLIESIRNLSAARLNRQLRATFERPLRPLLATRLKSWLMSRLPARYRRVRSHEHVFGNLRRHGAPEASVLKFRDEWTDVEATLQSKSFEEFLRTQVPDLVAADTNLSAFRTAA